MHSYCSMQELKLEAEDCWGILRTYRYATHRLHGGHDCWTRRQLSVASERPVVHWHEPRYVRAVQAIAIYVLAEND